MKVKCPKCRLSFEQERAQGIKELSCVCPRCGTPFTYQVPDSEETDTPRSGNNPDVDPQGEEQGGKTGTNMPADNYNKHAEGDTSKHKDASDWPKDERVENIGNLLKPTIPGKASGNFNRNNGCFPLKSCLNVFMIFLAILLVSFFGLFDNCSYNAGTNEDSIGTKAEENFNNQVDTMETFKKKSPEKAPGWIYGLWTCTTDYGNIKIHISGNRVTESTEDYSCNGTFYYQQGKLVCDFGDPENIMYYQLDLKNRIIDAGDGMPMRKIQ